MHRPLTLRRVAQSISTFALLAAMAAPAAAQVSGKVGEYSDATITNNVVEPHPVKIADDAELASMIKVPEGFSVEVVARDLGNPRMVAVHQSGKTYITRRTEGDVVRLDDADGDGKYEGFTIVAGRPGMHGIAFDGNTVFLVTTNDVYTAPVNEDGSFGELTRIIDDLPDAGQHPNRTLAIGPDDMLYITVGSTCNACDESNPENATIVRATKDGSTRSIIATGLRNTIGFGWEPTTGQLYGADHGIDWLGDEEQQEEFNMVEQGKQYGWPYVYDFSRLNPEDEPPEGITLEQWAEMSEEPKLGYTAHSAPMQMAFYTGTAFPEEYRGDAFIAMRGSWNRRPPSGYEIVRVDFEGGEAKSMDPFATGLLIPAKGDEGFGFLGRPTGLAQATDGSILFSDDTNGVLYRIRYEGENGAAETAEAQSKAAPETTMDQPTPDIALNLIEATADEPIAVTASFAENETIPVKHGAEGHNASPMLSWSGAPEESKSFVVIADDPDAKMPKPFTHWVAFDIPAEVTELREGVPTDPSVTEPMGMKQGSNSRGSIGYYGPRPPAGDPAHHYHFQVFATDLDKLPVDPGATRDEVLTALKGHVLAKGEIVGTYARPADEKPQH